MCWARIRWVVPEAEGSRIQLWCDVWKEYFGILSSDDGALGSKPSHLMLFTYNLIQLAHSPSTATLLAYKGKVLHVRIEEKVTHTHKPVLKYTNKQKHIPVKTQPKASPSHCCPSSETLKPGWHLRHVKEPSVFVHVCRGHVVGSAHSSISGVEQHRLLDIHCRTGLSLQSRKKTQIHDGRQEPLTPPALVLSGCIKYTCGVM